MSTASSESMQIRFRTVDGITLRYAESDGHQDSPILLTNPWPESLYAFLPIWQPLAQHSHLLAIDLPGFGQSERRNDLLSPLAMGEFLIRLVDEWGLDAPHVVAPDVGTAAALFAAALHPGKLRSLVVGNGGTAYPLQVGGVLKDFIDAPDLEAFRAIDFRITIGNALDTSYEHYKLPEEVREDYLQSYEGDRFVESMRYVRSYPQDLPILRDLLALSLTLFGSDLWRGVSRGHRHTHQRRNPPEKGHEKGRGRLRRSEAASHLSLILFG